MPGDPAAEQRSRGRVTGHRGHQTPPPLYEGLTSNGLGQDGRIIGIQSGLTAGRRRSCQQRSAGIYSAAAATQTQTEAPAKHAAQLGRTE